MIERINFYQLQRGRRYEIIKSFTDFYGDQFTAGEELTFIERNFLPYDGGHTLVFRERKMYLQETAQSEIIENFSDYLAFSSND